MADDGIIDNIREEIFKMHVKLGEYNLTPIPARLEVSREAFQAIKRDPAINRPGIRTPGHVLDQIMGIPVLETPDLLPGEWQLVFLVKGRV